MSWRAQNDALLGDFAFHNETFSGLANSYGFYWAVLNPSFTEEYISTVQAISKEDIVFAAKFYLNLDKAVILTINPEKDAK